MIIKLLLAALLTAVAWIAIAVLYVAIAREIKTCHGEPPSGPQEPWAWRSVDSRKCWYQGPRKYPRELLRWPIPEAQPARDEEEPAFTRQPAPPILARDEEFEDRWAAQYDFRWSYDPFPIERWKMW